MNSSSENETTPCRVFETSSSAFLGNHLSGALFTKQVTVFVVNIILIMPTLLLNAASIVTILKSSQLRSKPCYFIIFTAICGRFSSWCFRDTFISCLSFPWDWRNFELPYRSSGVQIIIYNLWGITNNIFWDDTGEIHCHYTSICL